MNKIVNNYSRAEAERLLRKKTLFSQTSLFPLLQYTKLEGKIKTDEFSSWIKEWRTKWRKKRVGREPKSLSISLCPSQEINALTPADRERNKLEVLYTSRPWSIFHLFFSCQSTQIQIRSVLKQGYTYSCWVTHIIIRYVVTAAS